MKEVVVMVVVTAGNNNNNSSNNRVTRCTDVPSLYNCSLYYLYQRKEIMFLPLSVCRFVSVTRLLKMLRTDYDEIFKGVGRGPKNNRLDFAVFPSGASKGTPATQNASQKSSGDKNKEVRGTKFKIVANRCHILRLKCTKFDFGCGSAPDPAGGAHSAPPDPLAGFKGSYF